jgi:Tol biopolymer transport system component
MISADGAVLAYIRTKDFKKYSLWAINLDGSNDHEMITQDDLKAMKNNDDAVGAEPYVISWIPGTHKLAFVTSPTFDGPGLQVNDDLWQLNADTGELTEILEPGQGGIFYYSPDGKQIALVTPKTITLINADGSNRRDDVLKFTPVNTFSEFLYYPAPKWAPDSSLLHVAIPPKDALSTPDQKTTLYEIPTDGSSARKLGTVTTAPLLAPEFSPDASRMVFVKVHGAAEDNQRELVIADPNGSNNTVYRTAQLDFNGWAPDSARFVFTEGSDTRLGQIGVDSVRLLSDTRSATAVDWLKNGQIVFLHKISNGWQIKLGMPGGTSQILISLPGDPDNFMPNFAVVE